jgi:hemerythrin superfamily protein
MDALDLLEMQHRDICEWIDRIEAEPSMGQKTGLVVRLVRMIEAHSRSEERHLYGKYAEIAGDPSRLYSGHEIHALTRHAADTLLRTRVSDVRFAARLRVVRNLFEQHASSEEDWLFQAAKRDITDEHLDEIGNELERSYALLLDFAVRRLPKRTTSARAAAARRSVARSQRPAGARRAPRVLSD